MADINIAQPMRFRVDVRSGLVEQPQRGSLMRGDKRANRIIVELVDGAGTFDITGVEVKGKFCRPPDMDEIDLTGTAEGNIAIVELSDPCYANGGHYEATVSLVLDGVERTVLFISGDVLKSGSGNAAGEGEGEGGGGGNSGSGLPSGGTAGQVLVKVSSAEGAAIWKTLTPKDIGAQPAGDYALKSEIPGAYTLPTATEDALGGVKSSEAVTVNPDGTMTVKQLNGKDANEYLQKSQVVNNFMTTEEGFVADARSLKVLHDAQTPLPLSITINEKYVSQNYAFANKVGMITYLEGVIYMGGYVQNDMVLQVNGISLSREQSILCQGPDEKFYIFSMSYDGTVRLNKQAENGYYTFYGHVFTY